MKKITVIVMVLSLSVMYQFATAQCSGNKIRIVKGSYHCGCHCQKKCISPLDLPAYQANGWYQGDVCFGSCCWIRAGEDASIETSLQEIYPNPASGSVTIAFTLSQQGEVSLEAFDVTGRYITTIAHTVFEEASNKVTWDVSKVNQGIYFLKMKAGSYSAIKRISVIK
ncbi:MAG TPA: T9SS type A sorting domain-containing protein [Bacteroidia bacterium]|nr:T9SS type A sorting domain-containing protein [Bacteroidia bacterium]